MSHEIIKELKERSQKFLNWIEYTVNDKQALKAAISYFEFQESGMKAIIKLAQIDLAAVQQTDLQNTSLNELLKVYNINRPFNYESAENKFKNGLELIITQGYSYNGMYYQKGTEKIWG